MKEENWMENTDTELLNLEHFNTKTKASDKNRTTFASTIESATSTHLSNKSIDKSEISDFSFTTASLPFDINKNDETTAIFTGNILSSTTSPMKNILIPKSPPKIL